MDMSGIVNLQDLDKSNGNCKIKARVTRMWPSVTAENGSLKGFNLILLDEDNYHVHAFAYHNIWNSLTTPIVEGGVYVLDQFSVKDSAGSLKPVQSKLCIKFTSSTTVTAVDDDGMIPKHKFELMDLGDLLAEANKCLPNQAPNYAIDIIAVLEKFENVKRIPTRIGDRDVVKFLLCDNDNELKVTIWGDLAISVDEQYRKQKEEPIIAIITSARLNLFMNSVQIVNLPSTKVFLNLDDDVVTDMRMRLKETNYKSKAEKDSGASSSETVPVLYQKMTLLHLNEKLTYEHLKKSFFCSFTVMKLDEDTNWWTYTCGTCQADVETIDNKFKCSNCPRTMPVADKRFRIVVLAEDSTFSCNIILMDRVVRKLIRTSAAKVVSDMKKTNEGGIPKIFSNFIGKEISVKLMLTKENVTEDSTLFYVDDIYDQSAQSQNLSESSSVPEYPSMNLTDSVDVDTFVETPGSAKSVNKKIKKEV